MKTRLFMYAATDPGALMRIKAVAAPFQFTLPHRHAASYPQLNRGGAEPASSWRVVVSVIAQGIADHRHKGNQSYG